MYLLLLQKKKKSKIASLTFYFSIFVRGGELENDFEKSRVCHDQDWAFAF